MGPGPRRSLTGPLLGLGLALTLGVAGLWAAPFLARRVVDGGLRGGPTSSEEDPARVDAFLDGALPQAGLALRATSTTSGGARAETWAAPPGRPTQEVAQALRQAARAEGIELHLAPRDELDVLVRVYAGSNARRELLLVPTLPPDSPPAAASNRRERPLLGLVIAGLGAREAPVVRSPLPLTVAVRPYLPHSLAVARDAARAWQEVLVEVNDPQQDLAAARAAIPFQTGLLLREETVGVLSRAGLEGLVVTPLRAGDPLPAGLLVLGAWQSRQRGAAELQARISHLLASRGATAVLIEHDDPDLPGLLAWAAQVGSTRYRLVLAHELARPADTLGGRDAERPAGLSPP